MVVNEVEDSKSLDPNTLNYIRIKILQRIRHAVDDGLVNTSDSNLTEVMVDLKTLLEDVETEMINRGLELKK
jgi:cobalamin biosynthesis Mg chelatase CobN